MSIAAAFLLLAGQAPTGLEPPKEPLVCRYESVVSRLLTRRKLCLTPTEWAKRDRIEQEAARRSIYDLMGNTDCLAGGLCTIE